MYLMKYLLGLKLINTSEQVAYFTKIAGKRRRLVQQQTNKRQLSKSYQQQYVRSRRTTSKTIAIRLYLDLLCVFSALVNSAAGRRLRILTGFPKILTKNMFSSHLKNCFCCHDKHKLLNSNWFKFVFCA